LSLSLYHLQASGFVKSTIPMPACQRSHCQTSPFGFLIKKPCSAASSKSFDFCAIYGLIQTHMLRTLAFSRSNITCGSVKLSLSHSKLHHSNSFMQKQSK